MTPAKAIPSANRLAADTSCMTPAKAFPKTIPRQCDGTAWWISQCAVQSGLMYDTGEGVPQNDTEAVRWYRLAAEQGLATAQFYLGLMYDTGRGVPQNDTEAVRWYRMAAEQGFAWAQFNLGLMYDTGEGIPQNDTEAVRWYRLASRDLPMRSTIWVSCMKLAKAFPKTAMVSLGPRITICVMYSRPRRYAWPSRICQGAQSGDVFQWSRRSRKRYRGGAMVSGRRNFGHV